ncbi:MAG: hypothetical protein RL885_06535 [Planctomycetota bacterium]
MLAHLALVCWLTAWPALPPGDLRIRAATVITLSIGTLPKGDIVIRDGRIVRVTPRSEAFAGREIEAAGRFVVPASCALVLAKGLDQSERRQRRSAYLAAGISRVVERRGDEPFERLVLWHLGEADEELPLPIALVDLTSSPGRRAEALRSAFWRGDLAGTRGNGWLGLTAPESDWLAERLSEEIRSPLVATAHPADGHRVPLDWELNAHGRSARALGAASPELLLWRAAAERPGAEGSNGVMKRYVLGPLDLLDIEDEGGRIEPGAPADLAIFDRHPLRPEAKCLATIVGGELAWIDPVLEEVKR